LNDSLSVIIPVRDAEATLAADLGRLLDVLPDLTHRFEIVVVDDGSIDQTVDLARDLAAEYPQLRLIRHAAPQGRDAAVQTGLLWAQGQTVFVQEEASPASAADLLRLWSLRKDEAVVMARAPQRPGVFDVGLLTRLTTWGQTLQSLATGRATGGIQMIRREAVEQLTAEGRITLAERQPEGQRRADVAHSMPPADASRQSRTFLNHLRDLALGE
jgi:hypothetical protein